MTRAESYDVALDNLENWGLLQQWITINSHMEVLSAKTRQALINRMIELHKGALAREAEDRK